MTLHLSQIIFTRKINIVFYGQKGLSLNFMTLSVCEHLKVGACLDLLQMT